MSFLSAIKNFFVGSPTAKIEESAGISAPYKIPEPAAIIPVPLVAEAAPVIVEKKKPVARKPRTPKA